MGLLDNMTPDQAQGLLQAGLSLLQSRGNFGNAIGQAGMAGVQGMQQYTDRAAQKKRGLLMDQLTQGQIDQQQAQQAQAQQQRDYLKNLTSPQMAASQTALAGGGGPTIANAEKVAPVDPMQQQMFDAVKAGTLPYNTYADTMLKYTRPDANTALREKTGLEKNQNTQDRMIFNNQNTNDTRLATSDTVDQRVRDLKTAPRSGGGGGSIDIKHGAAGLTPEQNAALFGPNGAVTTGKLDPNRVNSRTAALMANAYLLSPGTDMSKISADISLGRNASFRNRAMTAETLPPLIDGMAEAGKKVGFSDNRTVGKMQGFLKGEFNDPDMQYYMSKRADTLAMIASAARGAGMSDMMHRAETEAASPTMSPAALDAWARAQKEVLNERIKLNRVITRDGPAKPAAGGAKFLGFEN